MISQNQMIKYLKDNFAYILVWILALVPLVIWIFMVPLASRFGSSLATFRSLGQISGLVGMALLSLNFVLAARFKFLDKWFLGLNRVYLKHHTIGGIAFSLLLFHPTFLAVQYLFISLRASFNFIFSFNNFPVTLGEIALLVFIVLMVITFYLNFKYQNWKNTHKYLGIVLFFGGLHMFLVSSDTSNNALLKYYMLGLAALGAASYFYRTIFGIYKKGEYKYRLTEVKKINDSVVELKLLPFSKKIKFLPGQFIFVRFDNDGVLSESHPFSITSFSDHDGLSLGIKTLGDFTSMVYLLKPGAICRVEGPFGAFSFLKAQSKRQIWVAGGIGITPFLSMARQIDFNRKNDNDYKIDLYYSVKNEKENAFASEFREIANRNSDFRFYEKFSEKDGRISADSILKNQNEVLGAEIFLCGPLGFMKNLRSQFVDLGFNNSKIHSEEFNLSL